MPSLATSSTTCSPIFANVAEVCGQGGVGAPIEGESG